MSESNSLLFRSAPLASQEDMAELELGPEPFTALNYHLGMLLGAGDMQTEQAYHRGKLRLHNAWLHQSGVIWGYRVAAQGGEIHVSRGLGIDRMGRELYLDRAMYVDLSAWYAARAEEARRGEISDVRLVNELAAGRITELHLLVRYRARPTREVPTLAGEGDEAAGTAPSRLRDDVELLLRAGPAPRAELIPLGYRRLRLLAGLDPLPTAAASDTDPVWVEEARKLREQTSTAPTHAALIKLVHEASVRDSLDLAPGGDPDEPHHFPGSPEQDGLVLAALRLSLQKPERGPLVIERAEVDPTVRAVLLPPALHPLGLAHLVKSPQEQP